jgi:hypothetical protein
MFRVEEHGGQEKLKQQPQKKNLKRIWKKPKKTRLFSDLKQQFHNIRHFKKLKEFAA